MSLPGWWNVMLPAFNYITAYIYQELSSHRTQQLQKFTNSRSTRGKGVELLYAHNVLCFERVVITLRIFIHSTRGIFLSQFKLLFPCSPMLAANVYYLCVCIFRIKLMRVFGSWLRNKNRRRAEKCLIKNNCMVYFKCAHIQPCLTMKFGNRWSVF